MSLADKRSVHQATKLDPGQLEALLVEVPGYQVNDARDLISKEYSFKNFYQTIAFVNALAYIANQEDHHPDLAVSYNKCKVSFTTHDAGGLTENDFICAARVNALLRS
ncbi:MAG: 4a-hydroxytetrahydrobiopterin dehydratase [Polyangiaceae bacterium]